MPPIEFTLWTGDDILGQTQIPISKIVKPLQQKPGMDKVFDVLNEDFHLRLRPSNESQRPKSSENEDVQPTVRVEIALSRESPVIEPKPKAEKEQRRRSNSANHINSTNTTGAESELR